MGTPQLKQHLLSSNGRWLIFFFSFNLKAVSSVIVFLILSGMVGSFAIPHQSLNEMCKDFRQTISHEEVGAVI